MAAIHSDVDLSVASFLFEQVLLLPSLSRHPSGRLRRPRASGVHSSCHMPTHGITKLSATLGVQQLPQATVTAQACAGLHSLATDC